jgi:thymidylate synthase
MRLYQNFIEAMPEIKRDLVEMGCKVHPNSYQDKVVKNNPDFDTLELQNYIYTVIGPKLTDLNPNQPWSDAEWQERLLGIQGHSINPGLAWTLRKDVWEQFINDRGRFAYTYPERLSVCGQVNEIVTRIIEDPDSRQLFISIWNVGDSLNLGGISRVPCSLGYQVQVRKGMLNITYLQRSADLVTHFTNDVYLACKLQRYIAGMTNYEIGTYTHWIGSLHMFRKDSQGVF